jgi:sialidase-1
MERRAYGCFAGVALALGYFAVGGQGESALEPLAAERVVIARGGYFPKMLIRKNGELLCTFKTGALHASKTGRSSMARSTDGGRTWSQPVTVLDFPNADDSVDAVGELPDGTLIFSAVSYTWKGEKLTNDADKDFRADTYVLFSKDDGHKWTEPAKVNTKPFTWSYPYGRIVRLSDGTLLLSCFGGYIPKGPEDSRAGLEEMVKKGQHPLKPESQRGDFCFLVRSRDGGKSWGDPSVIARYHNEVTLLPLKNGGLMAVIRSDEGGHLSTTFSTDQGHSWTAPRQITANAEHPGDLLRLTDGRILLSYGERNRPYGIQAIWSTDEGRTWDPKHKVVLALDGDHFDLGYPISVQRKDGKIVTAYYVVNGDPIFKNTQEGVINAFTKAIIWQMPD